MTKKKTAPVEIETQSVADKVAAVQSSMASGGIGMLTPTTAVEVESPPVPSETVQDRLVQDGEVTFHGRVVDTFGMPVGGAVIAFSQGSGGACTVTDRKGGYLVHAHEEVRDPVDVSITLGDRTLLVTRLSFRKEGEEDTHLTIQEPGGTYRYDFIVVR